MIFNFEKFKQRDQFYYHQELLNHDKINVNDTLKWKKNNQEAKNRIEEAHAELLKYQILTEAQYQEIIDELSKSTSAVNGTAVLNSLVEDYHAAKSQDSATNGNLKKDGRDKQQHQVKDETKKDFKNDSKLSQSRDKQQQKVAFEAFDHDLPFGGTFDTQRRRVAHSSVVRTPMVAKMPRNDRTVVRQGGNSFNIDAFRDLLQLNDRNHYQIDKLHSKSSRVSLDINYFKFVKSGWAVRYRNFYTDEQIRNQAVMKLTNRDVIYLLMLQDLLHEVANNGLILDDVLHLGDALFSKPAQNLSFLDKLQGFDNKWNMIQRAIFEGMCEEQNKDHGLSTDEMIQKLSQQVTELMKTINQINTNTGISSQASVINLLKNVGLYSADDTRLVDQNGRLDLARLRHLWNHDLSIQGLNTIKGQVMQNQRSNQRNGYRYR